MCQFSLVQMSAFDHCDRAVERAAPHANRRFGSTSEMLKRSITRPLHPQHRNRLVGASTVATVESRRDAVTVGQGSSCYRRLSPDAGASILAVAPFSLPAHQTGRADLPHPAFRLVSPQGTRRTAFNVGVARQHPGSRQSSPCGTAPSDAS